MLTCICSKQLDDSGEDGARGTPSTKDAVKSLTSQIKDMALKFTGSYKQCKPCTGSSSSSSYRKGDLPYRDYDTASEGPQHPYLRGGGSASSTPAWDLTNIHRDPSVLPSDARYRGVHSGDRTPGGFESISARSCDVVLVDDDEPKEWMAQVEPGVHITFVSLPQGGNDLKRIRFSREMFNKWQAQRWWGENYDRIMELYNVQRFNRQALHTPPRSEDERDSYSRVGSARESPMTPPMRNFHRSTTGKGYFQSEPSDYGQHHSSMPSASGMGARGEMGSMDAYRTTTSSRDEASISISNASDQETEWVEQDEPGVYITIRALPDGTRELRRVRFSREKFGEVHAKLWWEQNRERIQTQYL